MDSKRRKNSTSPIFRNRINQTVLRSSLPSFFHDHAPGGEDGIADAPAQHIHARPGAAVYFLLGVVVGIFACLMIALASGNTDAIFYGGALMLASALGISLTATLSKRYEN